MEQVTVKLGPEEWKLIAGLRDIPESPLRSLTFEMMAALVDFVREPRCPELQADGAPCTSATADCDQCAKVRALLYTLRAGMA